MNGDEKPTNFQLHQNDILIIPPGVNPQNVVIIRPEDDPSAAITNGLSKPMQP